MAPFMVMEVLERAREMELQGVDIIHLEVGEPDFDVPSAVKRATIKALEEGAERSCGRQLCSGAFSGGDGRRT